jgi:hypothetical protein
MAGCSLPCRRHARDYRVVLVQDGGANVNANPRAELIGRLKALLANDVCKRYPLIVPILEDCCQALLAEDHDAERWRTGLITLIGAVGLYVDGKLSLDQLRIDTDCATRQDLYGLHLATPLPHKGA